MTTLALNNSYSGGTFINNGGSLQVGNGGNTGSLGSGPVAVNNGSLILMRSDAFFTMANTLSGPGAIYQNGGGTATLSGPASGFTGPMTINNGNLYLNSANSTSYITVAPNGVLGGKGSARRRDRRTAKRREHRGRPGRRGQLDPCRADAG